MICTLRISILMLLAAFSILSGCTHTQLRYNVVRQGNTLNDIFEKQVLDNLAQFSVKRDAIPSFVIPESGATNVSDEGGISGTTTNSLISKFYGLGLSRTNYDQWNLTPVYDAKRLALMRCAYQQAVGSIASDCVDCCELDRKFRGISKEDYANNGPCPISCGWVCTSNSRRDVPKCCCERWGQYCGTYAWVKPGHESDFANLVLRILEYAKGDFHEEAVNIKHVKFFIDQHGHAVVEKDAYGEVSADILAKDPANSILFPASGDAEFKKELESMKGDNTRQVFPQPTPFMLRVPRDQGNGINNLQQLQQMLRGVTPPGSSR